MSKIGALRIKSLSELKDDKRETNDAIYDENSNAKTAEESVRTIKNEMSDEDDVEFIAETTPVRKRQSKRAGTTSKKTKLQALETEDTKNPAGTVAAAATTSKKIPKISKKQLPPDQTKIDRFFKSCSKTYVIPAMEFSESKKEPSSAKKTTARKRTKKTTPQKRKKGRKRLFEGTSSETTETTSSMSCFAESIAPKVNRKRKSPTKTKRPQKKQMQKPLQIVSECVDLCTESEEELGVIYKADSKVSEKIVDEEKFSPKQHLNEPNETIKAPTPPCEKQEELSTSTEAPAPAPAPKTKTKTSSINREKLCQSPVKLQEQLEPPMVSIHLHANAHLKIPSPPTSDDTSAENFEFTTGPVKKDQHVPTIIDIDSFENEHAKEWNGPRRKVRTCPPYKIVAGTTFAVDGFQFGPIKGVTHYFLSHFHADHYIGLTRKFSMPLYLSAVTARLLRVFIPIDEKFLHILELNEPQEINGVEVTAIDANHCPGAIMFIFKLSTGKCILHTGDFRASPNMESEPVFWNNDIDTIYLDTTYISDKYAFCTQDESILNAKSLIEEFQKKHQGKKILYICGAYLIGKEKFWSEIARKFNLTVWTEPRRAKALNAIEDTNIMSLLNKNSALADMHVIAMGKLNYFSLVEYFEPYSCIYDLCLAIRPSGWEKNSKPQYRGKINIIGIEYSEHSSFSEMQRFVTYLKPKEVISTVPASGDLMITSKVPISWYKYDKFPGHQRRWQPSITSYLKLQARDNQKNVKMNCKENSTEVGAITSPQGGDGVSPTKLSLKVAYDADDDWLS